MSWLEIKVWDPGWTAVVFGRVVICRHKLRHNQKLYVSHNVVCIGKNLITWSKA
jgi:hypothetical protein